jgi:hypothetical protein
MKQRDRQLLSPVSLPLAYEILPGNTNDSTTLGKVWSFQLQAIDGKIERLIDRIQVLCPLPRNLDEQEVDEWLAPMDEKSHTITQG